MPPPLEDEEEEGGDERGEAEPPKRQRTQEPTTRKKQKLKAKKHQKTNKSQDPDSDWEPEAVDDTDDEEEVELAKESDEGESGEDDEEPLDGLQLKDVVLCKFDGRKLLGEVIELHDDGSFDVQWWNRHRAQGRFFPVWIDDSDDEQYMSEEAGKKSGHSVAWAEGLERGTIISRLSRSDLKVARSKGVIPAAIRVQVGKKLP